MVCWVMAISQRSALPKSWIKMIWLIDRVSGGFVAKIKLLLSIQPDLSKKKDPHKKNDK